MVYGTLLSLFEKEIKGKNFKDGERVFRNDLVLPISYEDDGEALKISGNVISENLYSEYNTSFKVSKYMDNISSLSCSCEDFEKKGLRNKSYGCKHICGQFLYFLNLLNKDEVLKEHFKYSEEKNEESSSFELLDLLAPLEKKEKIKIEVYLNKREWDNVIYAYFKIGKAGMKGSSLYTLKDIDVFFTYMNNSVPLKYGKDFTLDLETQEFLGRDLRLISFIKSIAEMDGGKGSFRRAQDKLIQGKFLYIPKPLLRSFLEIIEEHRIYLEDGFFYRPVETEILKEDMQIPFALRENNEEIVLKIEGRMPISLNDAGNVFLHNGCIYLPSFTQCEKLMPYLKYYNENSGISFSKREEEMLLKRLIPSLQKISNDVTLSNTLRERVVISPPHFKFYFDREEEIRLTLKVSYNGLEFNYFHNPEGKIVFRDKKSEDKIYALLRELGFVNCEDYFVFFKDEEYIFSFFLNEIEKLQEVGEVFYSESFKGVVNLNTSSFTASVRKGKHDYFDFEFNADKIAPEEFKNILRAFRDNKKYYKLPSGEFINLEEIELKKLLVLLNNSTDEDMNMPITKVPYFCEYIDKYDVHYFGGVMALKEIRDKIMKIKDIEVETPKTLKANLRSYQEEGLKFFKVLKECGYGGILGDEMGLGKTVQTIAFLLSEEGSKTLLVAPTSLIYNWEEEIKKFAPSLKYAIVNKDKNTRINLIKNYKDVDVLITTYNLLRIDREEYLDCEFDFCIIDEAQNIKNPTSQNATAVKEIKAKNRFALTGTPLENSLMELWSIFDFIMPNYLYDKKHFETRYFRRLEEEPEILNEVKALISPFILRRRKAEVLGELPDKIEKIIYVDMEEEQEKVYGSYSTYIKELVAKKVKDEEFSKSKIEILSYITKLRQIALDPRLVMEDYTGESGKLNALMESLLDIVSEGHKVLIFSQFTRALKNLEKLLMMEGISYYYLDGSVPSKKRMDMVNRFNEDITSVFLISLKAGGAGLNLTSADIVIHLDPWWNPAVENQATDRAHRIGQENVVEVLKFISKGTIEEKIIALQERKKEMINSLIEGENYEDLVSSLGDEDLIEVLK